MENLLCILLDFLLKGVTRGCSASRKEKVIWACLEFRAQILIPLISALEEFPDGLVRTLFSQAKEPRFHPWSRKLKSHKLWLPPKKR